MLVKAFLSVLKKLRVTLLRRRPRTFARTLWPSNSDAKNGQPRNGVQNFMNSSLRGCQVQSFRINQKAMLC